MITGFSIKSLILVIQSSISFLLTNHDTMVLSNSYIITVVKDVYRFPQSIAGQKNKRQLQSQVTMGT